MTSIKVVAVLLVLGGLTASVTANPSKINRKPIDLKAKECYTWGIKYNLSQGEVTTSSTLMYYDGSGRNVENNESWYTPLAGNASAVVNSKKFDSVSNYPFAANGANFGGNGALAGRRTDRSNGKSRNFNFVNDSLGNNPDRYNDFPGNNGKSDVGSGVSSDNPYTDKIEEDTPTSSVPAVVPVPGAIVLGSIGFCFVGWLRRRRVL